jgi:hypothetical protein
MHPLRRQSPRPRCSRTSPRYPRTLAMSLLALAAGACGGSVEVVTGPSEGGGGATQTATSSTASGGAGGVAGQGGVGAQGWGGGLDGGMPEPYGGGGAYPSDS